MQTNARPEEKELIGSEIEAGRQSVRTGSNSLTAAASRPVAPSGGGRLSAAGQGIGWMR